MARDNLLRLSGSSSSPVEVVTATGALNGGVGALVGGDKTVMFEQLIGTVAGTNPTLDTKIQDSANGSSWADTGVAFPQATGSALAADGTETAPSIISWRTTSSRPYVRPYSTIGGTASPSFAVEVRIVVDLAGVA